MISVHDQVIGWVFEKLDAPGAIEEVAVSGLSNEQLSSLAAWFGAESAEAAVEARRQCKARVVAEEAAMVAAAAAAVAAEPDPEPICVPHDADGLFATCVSAVAGYIRTHGCAVAAQVGSRNINDREVVILRRPWAAEDNDLREFADLACKGWDSAGQFSPGLPTLYFAEEAVDFADEADADEDEDDGRSGAIRLD